MNHAIRISDVAVSSRGTGKGVYRHWLPEAMLRTALKTQFAHNGSNGSHRLKAQLMCFAIRFPRSHLVLQCLRFGHTAVSCIKSKLLAKTPCVFSLNSIAFWTKASVSHVSSDSLLTMCFLLTMSWDAHMSHAIFVRWHIVVVTTTRFSTGY